MFVSSPKVFLFCSILGGLAVCAVMILTVSTAPPSGHHPAKADEFDGTALATTEWSNYRQG